VNNLKGILTDCIWDFLFDELSSCCKLILHEKELNYLSEKKYDRKTIINYIYIIERYLDTKVFPQKYNIYKSSKFKVESLNEVHKKSLDCIEKLLKAGDPAINSYSRNFVPNSIKNYFKDSGKELVKDFCGSIWGIKHLHLNPHNKNNDDTLLFYAAFKNNFYFIKIGKHDDLYKKDVVEIVVNEFPDILKELNIFFMLDIIPPSKEYCYTPEKVKELWKAGSNISYIINNRYYFTSKGQTFSKIGDNIICLYQKIIDQVETQMKSFISDLEKVDNNKTPEFTISKDERIENGVFEIIEKNSGYKNLMKIDCLINLHNVRCFKRLNLER
jgi:hypothetical protein